MADGVIHEHFQTAAGENQNYHVCLPMDKTNLKVIKGNFVKFTLQYSCLENPMDGEAW